MLLTQTYKNINNRFSVQYSINLVLTDVGASSALSYMDMIYLIVIVLFIMMYALHLLKKMIMMFF